MWFQVDLAVRTRGDTDVVNLTDELRHLVAQHRVKDGFVICCVRGSTAALTTIEYETNLVEDLREIFDALVPRDREYRHHLTWGDNNGHAHLRASLVGPSIQLLVREGDLLLGTWQQVVLIDFDTRPRDRTVHVALYAEEV